MLSGEEFERVAEYGHETKRQRTVRALKGVVRKIKPVKPSERQAERGVEECAEREKLRCGS